MTPYYHEGGYVTPPVVATHHCIDDSQEEVIFSLTERLREREDEVRHLRQENADLEDQLRLRGNPIQLDSAYEDLLAHLKQREEDFKLELAKQEDRHRELERDNRRLKDKVHASRKLVEEQDQTISVVERETENELHMLRQQIDTLNTNNAALHDLEQENRKLKDKVLASRKLLEEQEQTISLVERETGEELKMMQQELDGAMRNSNEKNRHIVRLEDMVQQLSIEADQHKEEEVEDKSLLARLGDRVETYRRDQEDLKRENNELQRRVETNHLLLKEKEDELLLLEHSHDHREDELNDDLERMNRRMNEVINSQRMVLDDKEEEIQLLYRQIDRYTNVVDEADYVTQEQRSALRANEKEIKELTTAIDRVNNAGLLSQLDKMCTGSNVVHSRNS